MSGFNPALPMREPPFNRFEDALFAQTACNPVALANALAARLKEVMAEGGGTDAARKDPACRLIAYQISFLMGTEALSRGADDHDQAMRACVAKSRDKIVRETGNDWARQEPAHAG